MREPGRHDRGSRTGVSAHQRKTASRRPRALAASGVHRTEKSVADASRPDRATGSVPAAAASRVDDLDGPLGRLNIAEIRAGPSQTLLGVGDGGLSQAPRLVCGGIDDLPAVGQRRLNGGDVVDEHERHRHQRPARVQLAHPRRGLP